jgi:uncharacterized protein (TIGR03067 family)
MSRKLLLVLAVGILMGAEDKKGDLKGVVKDLQGVWAAESSEQDGKKADPAELKKAELRLHIEGNKFEIRRGGKATRVGSFQIGEDKKPMTIYFKSVPSASTEVEERFGIVALDGDTLRVCFVPRGIDRPEKFETKEGSKATLIVYKRVKK